MKNMMVDVISINVIIVIRINIGFGVFINM